MSERLICTLSHTEIAATDTLCPGCGNIVIVGDGMHTSPGEVGAIPAPTATQAAAPVEPVAPEPTPRRAFVTCSGCGRPVDAADSICGWCAEPLVMQPTPAAAPTAVFPNGLRVTVDEAGLLLGRLSPDRRVGLAVDFDQVSRRHAMLRVERATVLLTDLGSAHGTMLDGMPVAAEVALAAGEHRVDLGGAIEIRVEVP